MLTGFLGGGKMAEALMRGLLEKGGRAPDALGVSDVNPARLAELQASYGVKVFETNLALASESDSVILAVKPQELGVVLTEIASGVSGKTVISIAAGRTLSFLEAGLPEARIVRAMPNLACQAGEGMTALCGGQMAGEEDLAKARAVFSCSGAVVMCAESQFDWVTAVSGSGPAFWTQLCAYEVEAAVASGMDDATARLLVLQTMLGTAKVLLDGGLAFDGFMEAVASKGGTTAAGLAVLRESRAREILGSVLEAAAQRSRALRS